MDGFRQGIEVDARSYPTNYFKFTCKIYIYIYFNNIKLPMPNLCLPPSILDLGKFQFKRQEECFSFTDVIFFIKTSAIIMVN